MAVAQRAQLGEVPGGGGNTPPAPCTGSMSTAATSPPRSAIITDIASMSSAGACTMSGTSGPQPSRFGGDSLGARPPEVRAVVAAAPADDYACAAGCPASPCVRRASLIAVSTASDPEPQRNTRAEGIGAELRHAVGELVGGGLVNGSKHE